MVLMKLYGWQGLEIPQSVACVLSFWKPVGWPHYSCESYWKVGWHYVNIYECTILQYINPTLGCKFSCSWTRLQSALHWPGWTSKKRRIDEAGRQKTHQIRSSKLDILNDMGLVGRAWHGRSTSIQTYPNMGCLVVEPCLHLWSERWIQFDR